MAVMRCARITIIMKMEPAAVAIITMNTVTSAGMSTITNIITATMFRVTGGLPVRNLPSARRIL